MHQNTATPWIQVQLDRNLLGRRASLSLPPAPLRAAPPPAHSSAGPEAGRSLVWSLFAFYKYPLCIVLFCSSEAPSPRRRPRRPYDRVQRVKARFARKEPDGAYFNR